MADLKNPKVIIAKGLLFLLLGLIASVLLILFAPDLRVAVLLAVAVWGYSRFYYFAFYVIQHYVDDTYRFAGLIDFFRYLIRDRQRRQNK